MSDNQPRSNGRRDRPDDTGGHDPRDPGPQWTRTDGRKRRQMGGRWDELVTRMREAAKPADAEVIADLAADPPWRLSAAALLYALLLLLHPLLFGASPWP